MDSVRVDPRYSSNRRVNAALIGCTQSQKQGRRFGTPGLKAPWYALDDRGIVDQSDDSHPYN